VLRWNVIKGAHEAEVQFLGHFIARRGGHGDDGPRFHQNGGFVGFGYIVYIHGIQNQCRKDRAQDNKKQCALADRHRKLHQAISRKGES